MKRDIERFVISEAKKFASRKLKEIAEDPGGFFTPHHEKITVLAFLGTRGEWRVSKGKVSASLEMRVDRLCKEAGVSNGWIARKTEGGRTWIDFSSSIPETVQQRISNAIQSC